MPRKEDKPGSKNKFVTKLTANFWNSLGEAQFSQIPNNEKINKVINFMINEMAALKEENENLKKGFEEFSKK